MDYEIKIFSDIDSALKKAEKLDKHKKPDAPTKKAKKISYKDFKAIQ